jgi:hypothetical protein
MIVMVFIMCEWMMVCVQKGDGDCEEGRWWW